MKIKKWLVIPAVILMALLIAVPVFAAIMAANVVDTALPNVVPGLGSTYGTGAAPVRDTFYAAGRNWLFYVDYDGANSDLVYTSAVPGEAWATPTVVANDTGIYGIEFAVFYDNQYSVVHYARHDMNTAPDEVKYRMGTPGATGTITWAAVEQTVAQVPAGLLTWRTTIAVDEAGYPWVAWIDTDGTNTFGQVFVESSTTRNGTWTEGETQTFGAGGTATDGTGTMTGSPVALDWGLNQATVTVAGTFVIDIPIGGSGTATTGGWTITGSPVALVEGPNTITVELGGAGTIDIDLDLEEHAWFVSLTPVGGAGEDLIEVQWSAEDDSSGDVGLYASLFDDDTNTWSTRDTVVAQGSMSADRPDGFSFYDIGSSVWVAYTDNLGSVLCRARSSIQTWAACAAAQAIKEDPGETLIPTLSGYENIGAGEDLICIVHKDTQLTYSLHHYGDNVNDWDTFKTIWSTSSATDNISRHVANYNYNPTDGRVVGFAWQVTDDSDAPDTDDLYYWWVDNQRNALGYYEGGFVGISEIVNLIPLLVLVGFIGTGIFFIGKGVREKAIKEAVMGIVLIAIALALFGIIVAFTGNALNAL